ncbi:MAG TPA: NAD(P)-dependent oxidoreductase [Patescibacteria group bacterium]|nr:NAD(P)-dependent oxidoreductase [Patescibacteria group bacterium]
MQQKVLITGGTGFLGVHLARKFLQEGWRVSLVDIAPLEAKDLAKKVTVIKADVRNKKAVSQAVATATHVIHAAAALPIHRQKKIIFATNVSGTKNVLEACLEHNVKRMIFISSTAVYGIPKKVPETEETPLNPTGYYGQSKVAAEKLCREYQTKGLEVTILRPKTFLGPERLGVFALWFEAIYSGHRVFILGNGKNKYQLLAVSDISDAIYKATTSSVTNQTFNLGAKEFQTWRKDLRSIIRFDKSRAQITSLPVIPSQLILQILEFLHLSPLSAWHYKTLPVPSYVSIDKAERLLHWHPRKSNQDLLLENYLWYKQHRKAIQTRTGHTHRVSWNFKLLNLISHL